MKDTAVMNLRLIALALVAVPCAAFATFAPHMLTAAPPTPTLYTADNKNFQYVGRVDFSDPKKPRFNSPGIYVRAKFEGRSCDVVVDDQVRWGHDHNYVQVQFDNQAPVRQPTTGPETTFTFDNLPAGTHTVTVVKDTETGIGWLDFVGLRVGKLLKPDPLPRRKIEFIGDSITAGGADDTRTDPCGTGEWYAQNDAYLDYAPLTAKAVNAQWMISAVSGIGLIHSCCNMNETMPSEYALIGTRDGGSLWDFNRYQPDVVTICLGQNDGEQDPADFQGAYAQFIRVVRSHYPDAQIVILNSPMADDKLTAYLKEQIKQIVDQINSAGDPNVHYYFFSRSWHGGCVSHPDLAGHQAIAAELSQELKSLMHW